MPSLRFGESPNEFLKGLWGKRLGGLMMLVFAVDIALRVGTKSSFLVGDVFMVGWTILLGDWLKSRTGVFPPLSSSSSESIGVKERATWVIFLGVKARGA